MAAPPADAGPPGDAEAQAFAECLRPSVEESIRISTRGDPRVLGDALYPAILPAIRQAIASAWNDMVEALSRILNNAFSPQGLRWRWESFRTGRPLGEIAYYHSLLFAVQQVLLIHRKSGLLLRHVAEETSQAHDYESISGMLTAIQDFVRDSFQVNEGAALGSLRVGKLTVWVEQGPEALLAVIIRGLPSPELRYTLRDALGRIHQRTGREMLLFEGDTKPFESTDNILRSCLLCQMRPARQPSRTPALALLGTVLALLLLWAGLSMYKRHRWNTAVAAIESRPGFVVTRAEWNWRRSALEGLRDPLAEHPDAVLRAVNIDPADTVAVWKPFLSLEPEMILARARRVLAPPAGVDLALDGDVLELRGAVPPAWAARTRQAAVQLPGIREIRFEGDWKAEIEGQQILFPVGSSRLAESQLKVIEELAQRLRAAPVHVEIVGHADRTGVDAINSQLSRARAEAVMRALTARGVPPEQLRIEGAGTGEEGRTVTFSVTGGRP